MAKKRGASQTLIQRSRSVGAAEKAAYHQLVGAGRSHVKRKFFELTQADADQIADRVGKYLDVALKQAG